MNPLKILLSLISSLALLLSGHSAPGISQTTNGSPTTNITSTIEQINTPSPSLTQLLGREPVESGCPQEGHIKSPSSFNKATIIFDNQTAGDLKVYWIDFQGNRKFYFNLKAHNQYDQETWIGHVWVVADGADQCINLHSANMVEQMLVIN